MTSTGQLPEPWKSTAATLFNPYLNINQRSNSTRRQSARTQNSTSNRQIRVPPESLVSVGNLKVTSSESQTRPRSKHFPSSNATEQVSIYVQQMIHYHNDVQNENNDDNLKYSFGSPNERIIITKRSGLDKQQTQVSKYELDEFFTTANDQMSRVASKMLGRESSFHEHYSSRGESPKYRTKKRQGLTLADMCNVASNVGDKMIQSKEKVGLEAIRGFRLPSARLAYEPCEFYPTDASVLLGQPIVNRVRLSDILMDDNFSKEEMIQVVENNNNNNVDDRASRTSRVHPKSATSTGSKIIELKDWRGKITQGNLPDVRSHSRRQRSESMESPQRPCTAASNLSKTRPESAGGLINDDQNEEEDTKISSSKSVNIRHTPVGSALKSPLSFQQRQRNYPLNVRIHETDTKQDIDQNINVNELVKGRNVQHTENKINPPALKASSEHKDEQIRISEIILRPSSESIISTRTTPLTICTRDSQSRENVSPDSTLNKRTYKLLPSASSQVYQTIPEFNENSNSNLINAQFSQLTLPQLELLENYDPTISTRIGAPFIPVQMLARPQDTQQAAKLSTEQIERDYPKKNGQPIFEIRPPRSTHNIIDVALTLQSTKTKRVPIERQTTFERPKNEPPVEDSIQIKSLENPNRLTIELYTPPKQRSFIKHTTSIKSSPKLQSRQSDLLSIMDRQSTFQDPLKDEERMESNLSVINMRTQQEVDQTQVQKKTPQKRLLFPTTIVTNANPSPPRQQSSKNRGSPTRQQSSKQQGRPIPSVFLTQDPDDYNYSTSVYRHAKDNVDIKRTFKGFISENLPKKLSAEERKKREEQQIAAIKIQRAYRDHLQRRDDIETRRPSTSQIQERERDHRKALSAKRAQHVERQLNDQIRIREENKQYKQAINDVGPSVEIFGQFNQVEAQFSKSTLNRAATCIQRWWRGFIIRYKAHSLREEVATFGSTWSQFIHHYRDVIRRTQIIRQSDRQQFHFTRDQAKDFLTTEKKLTTIYNTISFNDKLDQNEVETFFQCCDLSATSDEIKQALKAVLKYYPQKKNDSLTKDMVFDVVYNIYPPLGTGLKTSRKSTWVRPIIDGEDETDIQGTPFLEPIDMNVINKFLGKP
ncbi:unnamed protein product [Adineta steineri]|uniref:Uncharacterized protein n=1 Tax=Adineta steineri TaxID=433720 RepID=A0A815FRF7_9BILA|nr:unnamed protein product [Adineta steineri]CAF1329473.1 unnamed protein product [Adineta steineri]